MTAISISKKFLKLVGIILGGLLLFLFAFQLWLAHHSEDLIEKLVASQSNGKLELHVKKIKFSIFSRKMELQHAVFYSTDTTSVPVAYRFEVDRLKLEIKALLPILLEKKILIDSLKLVNPSINVTRLRTLPGGSDTAFSITQEMGRVYKSIQDALRVLQVDRFQIDNGKFTLLDKTNLVERPVAITNIFFHLDNLQVSDSSKGGHKEKILFSDNVSLQTTNQDILLPDGRHRISFSNFRINILKKLVEFDSCTIVASKGDSSKTSFSVFFDKLKLTNINFDTLYHDEVIKADSVYCINPRFRLDVALDKKQGPVHPPKLNELIQQLTGDMQLAVVMVENGSFDINTMREGRPSSFTSEHNNFEVQGLRIRKDAPKPLTVERFAMAIRYFENFLRDSSFLIQFDSILVRNNRVSLSNFSFEELRNTKVINKLSMPQFELHGLSWDDLVFEQKIKAEGVTLYHPDINYDLTHRQKKKSENIFQVLEDIGHVMQLHNFNIVDGRITLNFKNNAKLYLENATTSVQAQSLVASRRITGIRESFNTLRFSKGIFSMENMRIELNDVLFTGGVRELKAGSIAVKNKNTLSLNAKNVAVHSMLVDDDLKQIHIDGIEWTQAVVQLTTLSRSHPNSPGKAKGFLFSGIRGKNTSLEIKSTGKDVSAHLQTVSADAFTNAGNHPQIKNLVAIGNDLKLSDHESILTIGQLSIADGKMSRFGNIRYARNSDNDLTLLEIPALSMEPDINSIINGKIKTGAVNIDQPFMRVSSFKEADDEPAREKKWPELLISKLLISQPRIDYTKKNGKGTTSIYWEGKENNNNIELSNIRSGIEDKSQLTIDEMRFTLDHFVFTNAKGQSYDAGKGQINSRLTNLVIDKNDAGALDWRATIASLDAKHFNMDSIGKKAGSLHISSARLNNFNISSSSLLDIREMAANNKAFSLQEITGTYRGAHAQADWYNASFDKNKRAFSIDSFRFRPTMERDDFMKSQPYQTDYLLANTGRINISRVNLDRFIKDSLLELGTITINGGHLSDYRDKRMPREPGLIKPLPVNLLKKIPIRVHIDTVRSNNAYVEYTEMNDKTEKEGTVLVTRLNARITQLRNYDLKPGDSLRIRASAYIQDTLLTKLDLRESYTDSLAGFLMAVQMGRADLKLLNPILVPLASAEFKSGRLDTLNLRVVGREYLALGEMRMLYHDLKVRLIKKGETEQKSFRNGLFSFIANSVIKNKNTNHAGIVFFERFRDRSSINYLVKIVLSGVPSNVGIKKNRKLVRKYKHELAERNLPPINIVIDIEE